jgi:hypothetical protein
MVTSVPGRRNRLASPVGLLASAGAVVLSVVGSPPARADSTYSGLADARLIAVNFTAEPAVVFGQLIDGGASVVQAELTSLGTSTAFASDPYPSQSAVLAPGLIAGLSNGQTSQVIPNYPLIASSSNPTQPEQRVEAGPVVLEADSAETSSRGHTANGANTGLADVHYEPSSGQLVARAEGIATDIAISDQLVINGVRSVATATRAPSGQLQLTADFSVAALTIAGQRVPLGEKLSGPDGALTATSAAGAAMLKALEASGTTISYLPEIRTADGITSAGLRIRSVQHPPSQLASGVEQLIAEVTIGQTAASVENRALPVLTGNPAITSPAGIDTSVPSPTGVAPSAVLGVPVVPTGPAAPGAPAAKPPTVTFAPVASPNALVTRLDLSHFYLVLPIAGLAMVLWIRMVRRLGAR